MQDKDYNYKDMYQEVEAENLALTQALAQSATARYELEKVQRKLDLAERELEITDKELADMSTSLAWKTDAHVRMLERRLEDALEKQEVMLEQVGFVVNFEKNTLDPNKPRRYKTFATIEEAYAKVERGLAGKPDDVAHVHAVYIGSASQKYKSVAEWATKVVSAD